LLIYKTSATDDACGDVVAANKAVNRLFSELALICVQGR